MAGFLAGLGKGALAVAAGVWNLAPTVVKAANEAIHTLCGPTHDAVHAIAEFLTVAVK